MTGVLQIACVRAGQRLADNSEELGDRLDMLADKRLVPAIAPAHARYEAASA